MTAIRAVSLAAGRLRSAGCQDPRREAEYLMCSVLGTGRAGLYSHGQEQLPPQLLERFFVMVERREAREPVQHITGWTEFAGLEFRAGPGALVPRPETEVLLERFREALGPDPGAILDVGTGSGILAIALALSYPRATVVATDVSAEALAMAAENARLHSAGIHLVRTDLLTGLGARFDGVVANLPYIPRKDIAGTQPEVRLHDPIVALDGGEDGLSLIRRLVAEAPRCLVPGGVLALEASGRQPFRLARLLERSECWEGIERGCDLAGKPRWVTARLR